MTLTQQSKITEISTAVVNRLEQLLQEFPQHSEAELLLPSKRYDDLDLYLNIYEKTIAINIVLKNPIQYIPPDMLGLPLYFHNYQHNYLHSFITDFKSIVDNYTETPLDIDSFLLDQYDPQEQTAVYNTRIELQ